MRIEALPASALATVRTSGTDVSGHPVERVVAGGREPLRCCLRKATEGEEILLFGYEPALPPSPYREIGAVFAHAAPCAGPDRTDAYPADFRGWPQILRAYDKRGWIHPSSHEHDGTDPEAAIAAVLAHDEVVQIHSRNVAYGCYMFRITR